MKILNIVVDVEADGPCPGLYSMVSFGAATVHENPKTFYGETAPISEIWVDDALAVSGFTRTQHESFENPDKVMHDFKKWLDSLDSDKFVFWSDNPAFDFSFINYYSHRYLNHNPFGFSARRIGDLYSGLERDITVQNKWKYLRNTKHTHNALDDARGNVEALLAICKKHRIRI